MSEDPCRCEDMQVSERCCASCQGKGIASASQKCLTKIKLELLIFTYLIIRNCCYISKFCECMDMFYNHTVLCTVCAACRDYLSASQWIEIIRPGGPNKRITDCQEVADKYLYLCKKKYGMEGGHCCETCSAIGKSPTGLIS